MASLGLVPIQVLSGPRDVKKEFVDSQPQDKVDASLLVKFMNDNKILNIDQAFNSFIKSNPSVKSSKEDMSKYITKSGKVVLFDKKYTVNDYSNVDIHNFIPDNWLTDMGNFITDENEPIINNWIADYEEKTAIEIGIVTVKSLGDQDIFDYSQEQFNRLGVGKKYANNGILVVFSMDDRKSRIHPGYGVEGDLPDAVCGRILSEVIKPNFKKGDYENGILLALEEIKSKLGDGVYELKKKAERESELRSDMEFNENLQAFFGWLLAAALIASIAGGIVFILRKKRMERERKEADSRRIKEEQEKLIRDINKSLSDIKEIRDLFPSNVGIPNSPKLNSLYESTKKIIVSLSPNIGNPDAYFMNSDRTQESLNSLKSLLSNLYGSYKIYIETKNSIKSKMSEISGISSIKMNAYKLIDEAVESARKIEEYGYQAGDVPSKVEVDRLDSIFNKVTNLVSSDIDEAIHNFNLYKDSISNISSKRSNISTKLSTIESAISKVKNWERSVNDKLTGFNRIANSSEKDRVNQMIDDFRSNNSKDYIKLSSLLDMIYSEMQKAHTRVENEARRKREEEDRKRREEEEERRRKKRREEEEEDDRRRRSYSSSSSSSSDSGSSFGGFSGGSSSGGGASGDW